MDGWMIHEKLTEKYAKTQKKLNKTNSPKNTNFTKVEQNQQKKSINQTHKSTVNYFAHTLSTVHEKQNHTKNKFLAKHSKTQK